MLRRCRSDFASLALCAAMLGGCFGKVAYDPLPEEPALEPAGGGAAGPTGPTTPRRGLPIASGGAAGSGGGGGSGGALGVGGHAPQVEPPPPIEVPPCSVDCCPERLLQLTAALGGGALDADAEKPYLSADGAWVVWSSAATNLAPGASGVREIFLHSLGHGATQRLRPAGDAPPNGPSDPSALSADGRFLLITSWADNWALGDQNGSSDVFLFDRVTGEWTLISRTAAGTPGSGASLARDLSPDGRFVVYSSAAPDLTAGDDNGAWDVFVWDRLSGATERVSMGPGDQQTNPVPGNHAHISEDGRYVSFHSQSDQLVPGDANGRFDVFLADRSLGTTVRVSRSLGGGEPNGNTFVLGMSDDARYLSSYGSATDLVGMDSNGENDVFLFDWILGTTRRVNVGPLGEEAETGTTSVALSHDGRFLGFASASLALSESGDGASLQSYLYDGAHEDLRHVSTSPSGAPGNGDSYAPELSKSGHCVIFASRASNLTAESQDDGVMDVFVGPAVPAPR